MSYKLRHIDILSYLLLFLGIGVGAVAFWRSQATSNDRFLIILAIVIFYIIWGVVFHYLRGDLSKKLILEYLFLGMIGLASGFLVSTI